MTLSLSHTRDVQNDSADDHVLTDIADLTGTGMKISSILLCSLKRDVGVANDYGSDAYLLESDFHFEMDTIGSRQEMTK